MAQGKPSAFGKTAVPMAGSAVPSVRVDDPILASHTNALVRSVNRISEQHIRSGDFPLGSHGSGVIARVMNKTGAILNKGYLIRVEGQERERPQDVRQLVLSGYAFDEGDDMTRFGICAERIDPKTAGRVFVSGVCLARVEEPPTTYTVYDPDGAGSPFEDVTVDVYADSAKSFLVTTGQTDSDGEVVLNLQDGTYYIWRTLGSYSWSDPDVLEVSNGDRTRGTAQAGSQLLVLGATGLAEVIWEGSGGIAIVRFPVGGEGGTTVANWQFVWNED